ncbi:MAG TPA: undecaprenyl-diphosphatase UppP [Anaerolineales bacterium]|nr:undecaprenyl-diphosphatase UppP [Anaerolineales bacterium]
MTLTHALLLGIIQGLTEFIPVSSTAHLLIGQALLNIPSGDKIFSFNVIIQLGTVLAMLLFFWKDLWIILQAFFLGIWHKKPFETHDSLVGWLVIVATIPALIVGFLLKDVMEKLFNNTILIAAIRLLITAGLLGIVEYWGSHKRKLESASWTDAIVIGSFQVLAIIPGASRSGSTIAGGLLRGFDRPSAARMAFLMSAPILTAAGAYEALKVIQMPGTREFLPFLAVGFITAGIVGWFALQWLMKFLRTHSIYLFAGYCAVVGAICLAFSLLWK